jgi:hypothetical protein
LEVWSKKLETINLDSTNEIKKSAVEAITKTVGKEIEIIRKSNEIFRDIVDSKITTPSNSDIKNFINDLDFLKFFLV